MLLGMSSPPYGRRSHEESTNIWDSDSEDEVSDVTFTDN